MAKLKSLQAMVLILAILAGALLILPAAMNPSSAHTVPSATVESVAEGPQVASDQPSLDSTTNLSLGSYKLKVARRGHTSTALGDGRVAIIGGQNSVGAIREVEILNPGTQSIEI